MNECIDICMCKHTCMNYLASLKIGLENKYYKANKIKSGLFHTFCGAEREGDISSARSSNFHGQ
jgi:hypothetical protein